MKKAILIVFMALVLVIPAYAAEGDPATDQPIQQEQEPVVVATLDELQAAIDAAEDGDTIYIANTISISGEVIETDKDIVITHSDEFCGTMFRIKDGTIISGFKFIDNSNGDDSNITIGIISAPDEVVVRQCSFNCSGNGLVRFIDISGGILETFAKIDNCTFNGATNGAISAKGNTDVVIDSCIFNGNSNYLPGGSISTSGKLFIRNSVISGGSATSGGGILNSGELTISGCQINDNTVVSPKYGSDIFSIGTLTISDIVQENYNYYEESTGEKVVLPLVDYKNDTKLICLTEEQAADYFAPAPDDNKDEDTLPEQPQEPGDQTGDDDTTGEEQLPQKPTQPPEGREQIIQTTRIAGIRTRHSNQNSPRMAAMRTIQQIPRRSPRSSLQNRRRTIPRINPQILHQTRHSRHKNPLMATTAMMMIIPLQWTTGRHSVLQSPL